MHNIQTVIDDIIIIGVVRGGRELTPEPVEDTSNAGSEVRN